MQNDGRLYAQVAAQAGVSPEKALAAVYLSQLARAGKTIEQACALSRMERSEVRGIARDWGFSFSDYVPGEPVALRWIKPARGEWTLMLGGEIVARVLPHTDRGLRSYRASWERHTARIVESGSSALIAAKRLSKEIERQSIGLLDTDDVRITFEHPDGSGELLAPELASEPAKLRQALAA